MTTLVIVVLAIITLALAVSLSRARFNVHLQQDKMKALERKCEQLTMESDAKDLYVQNMSHEVRTPLNAVVGFAQLLALAPDMLTQEERDEYAKHIQHNGNMLTMLMDDILNIADIKNGNYSITLKDHPLNSICNAALASVQYRVKASIELAYRTNIPDDYIVHTDARRVQQILINYLTNAIKHTQVGSIILTTSLTEYPGMVAFAVTDTGEGVPIGQAKSVFRRFTKINDFVEGTGLGLNICLILSEKLGGKVFLDTSYTDGARFVFLMPVSQNTK